MVMSARDEAAGGVWTLYANSRPASEGVYKWRVMSRSCKGLAIQFLAHMRSRGAGFSTVISPSFDHWDGYRVLVPVGLYWRPVAGAPAIKDHQELITCVEGVELAPCPFCKQIPHLTGLQRGLHGVTVGAAPYNFNDWWAKCCDWAAPVHFSDPRELAKARAKLLSAPSPSPRDQASSAMLGALERTNTLNLKALQEFNWGESALSAESIRLLNEVPREVRAAIKLARSAGIEPTGDAA